MTIWLKLFLPSLLEGTGRTGRRSEVTAQLPLSFLEAETSRAAYHSGSAPFLKWPVRVSTNFQSHSPPGPSSFLATSWPSHGVDLQLSFTVDGSKRAEQHLSMQQPPACSTSASSSWLTILWSSPSYLCLSFCQITTSWSRYFPRFPHPHEGSVFSTVLFSFLQEGSSELRPRLCVIQRDANGYGFNLHSERARPGQYVRAVDEGSPAERAGLQPTDRIVQVLLTHTCTGGLIPP